MLRFPPPQTFADGERKRYGILMALAGMFFGASGALLTIALIYGPWSASTELLRLKIIGGALLGFLTGSIIVTLALAVGGPVGRVNTKISKDGVDLNLEGDE